MKIRTHSIIAIFGILLFNDVLLPLLDSSAGQDAENTIYKVLAFLLYIVSFYYVFKKRSKNLKLLKNNPYLIALLCLAVFSIVWSVKPGVTFQRGFALIGTTLFGVYLFYNFNLQEFVRILLISLLIISLLSLLLVVLFPNLAIHSGGNHQGLWRGAFAHKNIMARTMSFGVILSGVDRLENFSTVKNWKKLAIFFLCLILLFGSGGKTGLLITLFSLIILYPILKSIATASRKQKIALYITMFLSFITVAAFTLGMFSYAERILGSVGGDITLTGRTILWELIFVEIYNMPILGYGFGAFWESKFAENIWFTLNWEAPHAHNGFLEIMLDFGLIGLALFLMLLFQNFRNGFKCLADKDGKGIIILVLLSYLILYSIPGNSIISQNSLSWFLFIYLILHTGEYKKNY